MPHERPDTPPAPRQPLPAPAAETALPQSSATAPPPAAAAPPAATGPGPDRDAGRAGDRGPGGGGERDGGRDGGRDGNPYLRLFAVPGARAFTAGNLLARLPVGMFSLSAVFMISGSRGSYALAGAVTASGLATTAVVAPYIARLVDRHGQARVAVPATALSVLGSLALLLCVHYGAPAWTLFVSYAATATMPNTGGMSRARWAHLFRDDPAAVHTANSFEQAADELCFMTGPVLAAFLCTSLFPEAGTLTGTILLMSGILLFAAQRSTQPPAHGVLSGPAPLRSPGMPVLLAAFLALGTVFGSMEVVTVAFADAQGHKAASGMVLALQATGSGVAGLVYGTLRLKGTAERRFPLCLAAMAVLWTLPLLAATATGSLLLLGGVLLIAGMATAPTMVTGMTLVQRRTPEGRINEGMTLSVTALLSGVACGAATGGWAAEHLPPGLGYTVPLGAATLAFLVQLASGPRRLRIPRVT